MSSTSRINRKVARTQTQSPRFELLEGRRLFSGSHIPQVPIEVIQPPRSRDVVLASSTNANIVWTNRANTTTGGPADTDLFGATFGTSAPACAVVDAAILAWERVIGSFNYSDGRDYLLSVSMSNVGNSLFRTVCNATWQFEGKPYQGEMVIGKGRPGTNPNDDNDWFLDPTPNDNSEFDGSLVNAFTGDAPLSSPAWNKADLYSAVVGELTHGMGMMGDSLIGWRSKTIDTAIPDTTAEGGGVGTFWTFNGPSIRHLLTSNIDGPSGFDSGQPYHSGGPGVDVPFGAFIYKGAKDLGNTRGSSSQRSLVNEAFALMLKDAYGYSTTNAAASGTFYSNLNQSTGVLTVRGGDFGYVMNNSSDTITISRSGSVVTVSVDVGNDVPGTGALPGDGNLPAWVSQYDISQISSITVDAGNGDDAVNVSAQLGLPVTVQGSGGADVVNFNDPGVAQPTMFADATGFSSGATTVTIAGGIEASIMTGNGNPAQMFVSSTAPGRPLLVFGGSANLNLTVSECNASRFPAAVSVNGGGGANDVLIVGDGPIIGGTSLYTVGPSVILKNNGFAGISYSNLDQVQVIAESGPNQIDVLTGSLCPVRVDGGATQDVYNVLSTASSAPVIIDSAFGNDTLNINLDNAGQGLAQVQNSTRFGAINLGAFGRLDVLAGTNSTVTATSISTHPQGSINLFDNDFILDYTGASQLANVQALINAGRAAGWVGTGIVSFAAKNNALHNTTLGAMEATDYKSVYGPGATFNGQPIDNTAVVVKYTYYGDADFNGTVNFDDYSRTDGGFNFGRTGWLNGDFDGNGVVDFDDYSLLDQAFNTQGVTL